jgi:hypothetical protein
MATEGEGKKGKERRVVGNKCFSRANRMLLAKILFISRDTVARL